MAGDRDFSIHCIMTKQHVYSVKSPEGLIVIMTDTLDIINTSQIDWKTTNLPRKTFMSQLQQQVAHIVVHWNWF